MLWRNDVHTAKNLLVPQEMAPLSWILATTERGESEPPSAVLDRMLCVAHGTKIKFLLKIGLLYQSMTHSNSTVCFSGMVCVYI